MSSIAVKKAAKTEVEEQFSGTLLTSKLIGFLEIMGYIVLVLLGCFLLSPTLFYAIQMINHSFASKNMKYKGYGTYDDFYKSEIICGKDGPGSTNCNPLPYSERPLQENISDAFSAAFASSYFTTRDKMVGILEGLKPTVDTGNKYIDDFFGSFLILLWPVVYGLSYFYIYIFSSIKTIFTFFTTLNKNTLIKAAILFGWPIVFWWMLMIPPFMSFMLFLGLISILILLFILVSNFSSLYTIAQVFTSVYWDQGSGGSISENIRGKLKGFAYEYPRHARKFKNSYYYLFFISNLISLIIFLI